MGFLDRFRRSGGRGNALSERMLLVPTPETDVPPAGPPRPAEDREPSPIVVAHAEGRGRPLGAPPFYPSAVPGGDDPPRLPAGPGRGGAADAAATRRIVQSIG